MTTHDSYTLHIEPETEELLQEVHQLAMKRKHKYISFDRLIRTSFGAYKSVIKSQIKEN